jgi:hypothetical protein
MRFAGDAMTGDYLSAAGTGGSDVFKKSSEKAPNYGKLGIDSMVENSKERQAAFLTEGKVAGAGISSIGAALAGQNEAQGIIAAGEAAASATQSNAMSSMIGDIGGGIMGAFKPKFNYGQTKMGAGGGVVGGYGTLGPNYGIKQY